MLDIRLRRVLFKNIEGFQMCAQDGYVSQMNRPPESARTVALAALLRVVLDEAFLDRALPPLCDKAGLGPEARGLATEIAFGVLRRMLWLDRAIGKFTDRPCEEIDPATLMALRIGAYQMYVLDRIPAHAAVSETVSAVKLHRQSAASFVNAVLRKMSAAPRPPHCLDDGNAKIEDLALAASVPPWVLKRFAELLAKEPLLDPAKRLGKKGSATAHSIALKLARPAQPTLRVLSRRRKRDALLAMLKDRGADARPTPHSPHGVAVARIGDPSRIEGFGYALIAQDEAAQWVASLADGEKGPALDACAAPGGKTLALWDAGIEPLTALEVQPKRKNLLERTLQKADIACEIHLADARTPPDLGPFKTIFIDAPCSGSGTLMRRPELRWKLAKSGVMRLRDTQAEIMQALCWLVAPGGALIYAVCSVLPEEGEEQIATFLAAHPEFTLEAWLETLSHHHTMDGFFAAKLRRKE